MKVLPIVVGALLAAAIPTGNIFRNLARLRGRRSTTFRKLTWQTMEPSPGI